MRYRTLISVVSDPGAKRCPLRCGRKYGLLRGLSGCELSLRLAILLSNVHLGGLVTEHRDHTRFEHCLKSWDVLFAESTAKDSWMEHAHKSPSFR